MGKQIKVPAEKAAEVEAKKLRGEPKKKGGGIGAFAIGLLKDGVEPKEVLERVRGSFPGAKTQMASIYWYANHEQIDLQAARMKRAAIEKAKSDQAGKDVKKGASESSDESVTAPATTKPTAKKGAAKKPKAKGTTLVEGAK